MGVPLYLLISGHIFWWGLLLMAIGVSGSMWRPGLGSVLAWSGLVFTLASAVPIDPLVYALLCLLMVGWRISRASSARVRRWMAGLVVVGTAVAWVAALIDGDRDHVALSTHQAVFVIGDSLSAGLGSSSDKAWPQLVSGRLNLELHNLARAGATLADGRAQASAMPDGPATVLVELGGNDLLGNTTPSKFRMDLGFLLDAVVGRDRTVLMFELPLVPLQNSFGRIQRDECRKHGVALLPRSLLAGAVALPGNTTDGLHLSVAGHAWLAGRVGELWRQP